MQVFINQTAHRLEPGCCLAHALTALGFVPPYAVAVNLQFVPKSHYEITQLNEGDQIEVISPITGG